jgi:hypothetical protein
MFGHRVNSEGLRRRTIAPRGGAPKRVYICFAYRFCQPFCRLIKRKKSVFFRGFSRFADRAGARSRPQVDAALAARCDLDSDDHPQIKALPAPHCGHIPQPFFGKQFLASRKGVSDSIASAFAIEALRASRPHAW